jgi:hypothetical protein
MEKNRLKIKKNIAVALSLAFGISVSLFVIMLLFNVTDYGITIASFGATIFMVLSKKNLKKRVLFGSYMVGGLIGFMFSRLSDMTTFNVGLAAVSSVIIMTVLELQHAPAIGMAVAMVLNKFPFWTDVLIILCIFFIIGVTLVLKTFLEDPAKVVNFVEIEEERIKWNFRKKEMPEYIKVRTQRY